MLPKATVNKTISDYVLNTHWSPLQTTVLYGCVYSNNTWSGYSWLFEHISMACNVSMGDHFTLQSQWCDSAQKGDHMRPLGNNCNSFEWPEWVVSKIAPIAGGFLMEKLPRPVCCNELHEISVWSPNIFRLVSCIATRSHWPKIHSESCG